MPAEANPTLRIEPADVNPTLRITEIFHSIQGESSRVGLPTVFVRLTGCPLRCVWCDTAYAFSGGESLAMDEVLRRVGGFDCRTVCVTGGEPLAQKGCLPLLAALCDAGYSVSLETSGALDIAGVDPRVSRIVDLKAPGSGEQEKNRWENLALLTARDELKFVLASRADYDWAVAACRQRRLFATCPVLFSPVHGQIDPARLAQWILDDRLPLRFQLQLHKLLWGNAQGR
ncbi:MAG: 7-carboxy-7-deazaguanine synthase QueE [Betaproteobacteria bacterium]|nr:7-carboxy-7-deazaguanine synthase QueE [Betaproteobacteria bacterium]